jgi:hypothetical protein
MMLHSPWLIMQGTTPVPLVPEMPTDEDIDMERSVASDGGESRNLPKQTFGAPLVPDYS